jgi:hypothetical protein
MWYVRLSVMLFSVAGEFVQSKRLGMRRLFAGEGARATWAIFQRVPGSLREKMPVA